MTNHWSDIDNASLVLAFGANPAENHPACMAHINAARFGTKTAKLIVIDPRKTRTALQADKFIRIRPGTNIAFTNGVLRYIMNNISGTAATNYKAWLNGTAPYSMALRNFCADDSTASGATAVSWPKYVDANVRVDTTAKNDYVREVKTINLPGATYAPATVAQAAAQRPTVINDGGTYKMWYVPASGFVMMSTSTDAGVTFPVGSATNVAFGFDAPHVFKDGSTYYMLNNDGDNVTVRSSDEGLVWTAPVIIFAHGTIPDSWAVHLDNPSILKDGNTWRLYFQAHNTGTSDKTLYWIYSATTTVAPASWGGASFSLANFGSPVLKPTAAAWDAFRVMQPMVVKDGPEYFMWYVGYNSPTDTLKIGWARSADGVAWTKQGTAAVIPAVASRPVVIKDGTNFVAYYGGPANIHRTVNAQMVKSFTGMPALAANIDDADSVYQILKTHVGPYTTSVVADICGCAETDISYVGDAVIANSRCSSVDFGKAASTPTDAAYKAMTVLYAMGQTQFANGSQNIKDLAVLQSLMGNMGRAGGGINALRGIHNVQGSTDMGLLFDAIPGYSDNPGKGNVAETYEHYANKLFGNRLTGNGSVSAYTQGALGLQQKGFYNMTREWFGDTSGTYSTADFDSLWALWPKDDGYDHITAFRQMQTDGKIKACYVIGQNPAVTEPNQSEVRDGLYNLDLLVVQDMFETETAACHRKGTGVTYLLPACAHVEEAGSVTNSGRWLQWRERATTPKGNSKADIELILRLAKALDLAGGFSHIPLTPNAGTGTVTWLDRYDMLWRKYTTFTAATPPAWVGGAGWVPGVSTTAFDDLSESVPGTAGVNTLRTGSELVCERIFKEVCSPAATGTMWIYANAYNTTLLSERPTILAGPTTVTETDVTLTGVAETQLDNMDLADGTYSVKNTAGTTTYINGSDYTLNLATGKIKRVLLGSRIADPETVTVAYKVNVGWGEVNRARSRNNTYAGGANSFPRWGWAWLYNRRVFYNNTEVPNDEADNFVTCHLMAGLFTLKSTSTNLTGDFALSYRAFKTLKDTPTYGGAVPAIHGSYAGRFPAHTEPYESPRDGTSADGKSNLVAVWGRNSTTGLTEDLIKIESDQGGATLRGTAGTYPLVLTTIRCVEHFQGGPTTRNNTWNVEAEPVPWIEINSVDARRYGIADGDWVNVTTARSNSHTDQEGRTVNVPADWARGFKARVGVGLQTNQRIAAGVVAIPWHWGDKGLSTGSRANDLCIDAWDANTKIPEYKVCLCKIEKM